ncbi:response regulator [candidate division KSB1 bacterium]|nr:response regulator [candidate division KSB1 bacterium]
MGFTVLVVDDSSVMRKIISKNLRQAGVKIDHLLEAGDGQEGLEQLEKWQCDIILSDINMPNMDGLEFVKEIRKKRQLDQCRIIMITTESGTDIMEEVMNAGANGYVVKPFSPDQILDKINRAIR